MYRYAPHNDVSVNDGPHIRLWSHQIIILQYCVIILTIVLQLPTVLSRVTCCRGLQPRSNRVYQIAYVCSRLYYLGFCKYKFAQRKNRLTTHFSGRILVIKRRISVCIHVKVFNTLLQGVAEVAVNIFHRNCTA